MKDTYKKAMCIAACVLGVSLVSWTTWRLLPSSADEMRRCAVVVSATSWYEVTVDGKPLLYFAESDADSACTTSQPIAQRLCTAVSQRVYGRTTGY